MTQESSEMCVLVGRGAEAGGIYRVNTAVTFFYCQQQRYVHSFSLPFMILPFF